MTLVSALAYGVVAIIRKYQGHGILEKWAFLAQLWQQLAV